MIMKTTTKIAITDQGWFVFQNRNTSRIVPFSRRPTLGKDPLAGLSGKQ